MTTTAPRARLSYPWLLGAGLVAGLVQAEPVEIQTGRYTVLAPVATAAQADPLQALMRLELPRARPLTVADAIARALRGSGFSLAAPGAADPLLVQLLAQPLPASQRSLGPMALERTLNVLAGPAWRLVVDRLHRQVSFEASEPYASYRRASAGPMSRMQQHPLARPHGIACQHPLSAADGEQEALSPMRPAPMGGASP